MRMKIVIVDGRQFCTGGKGIRFELALNACNVPILFYLTANRSVARFQPFRTSTARMVLVNQGR
jgi:hypothetical protein